MTAGPIVFVVGGHDPDALRRTVASLGARTVWCAVASIEEQTRVAGLARTVLLDPWPGTGDALDALVEACPIGDASAVVLVRAGTVLRRGALAAAVDRVADGAPIILPVPSRATRTTRRIRLRTQPRSKIVAPSGIAVSPAAFEALRESGWLSGRCVLQVRDLVAMVGRPRVAHASHRPKRTAAKGLGAQGGARPVNGITVIVPAHNEEAWIGHTVRSLFAQTRIPDEVIVVDDGSGDRTGEIAREVGARVIRPEQRQGRKAAAVNVGLAQVRTDATLIVDADTLLDPEAIEHLMRSLEQGYDATCGGVRPNDEGSLWARGRGLQYALARRFFKPIQRDLRATLVLSGCIAAYRTEALRAIGGLSDRTVGEDLDATWELYLRGGRIGFAPEALALTAEPATFGLYRSQIRRWASGLFQSVKVHKLRLRRRPGLLLLVAAILLDLVTTPIGLIALPMLAAVGTFNKWWLIIPAVMNLITIGSGIADLGFRRTMRAIPGFFVMVWTDLYFYLESMVREMVLRRSRLVWEKGH